MLKKRKIIACAGACMAVITGVCLTTKILSKANNIDSNSYVSDKMSANQIYAEISTDNDTEYDVAGVWEDYEGQRYMFLPSQTDTKNVVIWSTYSDELYIDNNQVNNGQGITLEEGQHSIKAGNDSYTLNVMKSENIPAVYISLNDGKNAEYLNETKDNKASGNIAFIDENGQVTEAGLSQIKGRGNSSWDAGYVFDKFPYNIKLEEKTDVFGMGAMKKWCLLANALDESLIRNKIVGDIAEEIGMEYNYTGKNIDLYINGEYLGNYFICEKVEVGKTSLINITDLEKATEKVNDNDLDSYEQIDPYGKSYTPGDDDGDGYPDEYIVPAGTYKYYDIPNDPEDITGGYLLEFDYAGRQAEEASGFVTDRYQPITIKSPEFATKNEVLYIKDYMQRVEDAVYSDTGYNDKGEYYADLIDVESFAKVYLINEFTKNLDSGESSYYVYKDVNGVLKAGPVWDYDWALGSFSVKEGVDTSDPDGWYTSEKKIKNAKNYGKDYYNLSARLSKHEDFMVKVKEIWRDSFKSAVSDTIKDNSESTVTCIDKYYEKLKASAKMNYTLHNSLEKEPIWGSADTGNTFSDNYDYLRNFISNRIAFMSELDNDIIIDSNMVYYDNKDTKWDEVYCYYWKDGESPVNWPGVKMTGLSSDIFAYELPEGYDMIIFSGNNMQTADLSVVRGKVFVPVNATDNYFSGLWENKGEETGLKVYFDNSLTSWDNIKCYWWKSNEEGPVMWPGISMNYESDKIYSYTIPEGYDCVIFNNANGIQTEDLMINADKIFVPSSTDNKINGEWIEK
ncbi:MAG: CotH kinase family protein [Lachnospiraceae bacterium]|nr:CotH kinase family protein [Lachnospiraceae bacterium]